jgi:hypothetical protein
MVAMAALDKRLAAIGQSKFDDLGLMVLAYCGGAPDERVAVAATNTFALFIMAQPGRRFELKVPGSEQ